MTSTINYDYMSSIDDSVMNGYRQESNNDLDEYFNFPQVDGSNFPLQNGLFTPNGVNINGGMVLDPDAESSFFQFTQNHGLSQYDSNRFSFPQQANSGTTIEPSEPFNTFQPTDDSQNTNSQEQGHIAYSHGSEVPVKRSAEPEGVNISKPKRTRRSKKKQLTAEQEDKKRKEFLERNRQAASKCRVRKQEATSALQTKTQEYSRWNCQLKENANALELEIAELKALLFSHPKCNDPEIAHAIEFYKSRIPQDSVVDDMLKFDPTSGEMQRRDSWISVRSDDAHNPDGSLNKLSSFLTGDGLLEASQRQKAELEEYMKEEFVDMSSKESSSSSEVTDSTPESSE